MAGICDGFGRVNFRGTHGTILLLIDVPSLALDWCMITSFVMH